VVYHAFSNYNVPNVRDKRLFKFQTVHDVIPVSHPELVSRRYAYQFRQLFRKASLAAESVVCVSPATKQELLRHYPELEVKLRVVLNGYDRVKTHPKDSNQTVDLLTVGRFEKYKRVDLAVECLRHLGDSYRLTVVTDQPGAEWLRESNGDLLENGRLNLRTGMSRSQMGELYTSSQVLVFTSVLEGFGLPVVEALTHGCGVVAVRGVGINDLLTDSTSRLLNSDATAMHWAKAIEEMSVLQSDPSFSSHVSENLKKFPTWSQVARNLSDFYSSISW